MGGDFRMLGTDAYLLVERGKVSVFCVSSEDVIHSFAVPSMGIKIDATPGKISEVFCDIFTSGVYYGQCSEICGVNHTYIPVTIVAYPFWLESE